MFFTSSVFVKSPKRVAAIALVMMGLSLLVYALGERALRRALKEAGAKVRHQTGKPTERPTLRWVLQLFQAVHLLNVEMEQSASPTSPRSENASWAILLCPAANDIIRSADLALSASFRTGSPLRRSSRANPRQLLRFHRWRG